MSYTMRDDQPIFGNLAAVEHSQGYGPSVIGAIQSYEPCSLNGETAATIGAFNTIFIAPPVASASLVNLPLGQKWQVVGVSYHYQTASSSGTVSIEICPAGTADGSGTNVLSATNFSTSAAATNTPIQPALNTNVDNLIVVAGGRINVNTAGTQTGLVNLTVVVNLARLA
jgi:hypothetical protein